MQHHKFKTRLKERTFSSRLLHKNLHVAKPLLPWAVVQPRRSISVTQQPASERSSLIVWVYQK